MKTSTLSSLTVSLFSVLTPARVSYQGYQVIRVASTDYAKDLIHPHALSTWADMSGVIDVVVPPGFKAFEELEPCILHTDLGRSVAEESQYEPYLCITAYHSMRAPIRSCFV